MNWSIEPQIFSTPESNLVNFSSHITNPSSLEYELHSTIHQHHQAGLRRQAHIFDNCSIQHDESHEEDERNRLGGLPEGWKDRPEWRLKYIDDGLNG